MVQNHGRDIADRICYEKKEEDSWKTAEQRSKGNKVEQSRKTRRNEVS